MGKIRVLVVDDSVVIRKLVTDVLSGDAAIEVAATAPNGRIALAKIPQVNPDLVTLDIEMPEMNGLETMAAIHKTYPRLPVIMFSTLTERGAAVTLDALSMGASDYVTKPANVGSASAGMQRVRDELIPKIKALCVKMPSVKSFGSSVTKPSLLPKRSLPACDKGRTTSKQPVEIVAIGVSTGGPNALAVLLPQLAAEFPVPVVIVQHMPPIFTRFLADRLATLSSIRVFEGAEGQVLRPAQAWVAPGDYHMVLKRSGVVVKLQLHKGQKENSCRPSVDVLFRSVAEVYGPHTLAVVMTGMGNDGLRGCEDIHAAGGQIVVQDEDSSVVWGMPGYVARAELADKVLSLDMLGGEIGRRVQRHRAMVAQS